MMDLRTAVQREASRVAAGGVCSECGYNLPHHGPRCPAGPQRKFFCPEHDPGSGWEKQDYSDGRGQCSVCGKSNYAVKPFTKKAFWHLALLGPSEVRTVEPEEFHRSFSDAVAGSEHENHVTNHSPEEIRSKHMTPLLTNGGRTGVLVHNHGDGRIEATGLFNSSGVPGAGGDLLRHAVSNHGVNYVEAFGPKLPRLYRKAGFVTRKQFPFDRSQADQNWNFKTFDSPNYHLMTLRKGGPKLAALQGNSLEEWAEGEEHWDDPEWVAALRSEIEADIKREDPAWFEANKDRLDAHWAAAMHIF